LTQSRRWPTAKRSETQRRDVDNPHTLPNAFEPIPRIKPYIRPPCRSIRIRRTFDFKQSTCITDLIIRAESFKRTILRFQKSVAGDEFLCKSISITASICLLDGVLNTMLLVAIGRVDKASEPCEVGQHTH
jgi:hypothetical protein